MKHISKRNKFNKKNTNYSSQILGDFATHWRIFTQQHGSFIGKRWL